MVKLIMVIILEVKHVSANQKSISKEFKMQVATELGLAEKIQKNGWGSLTSKEIGSIVKRMVEKGEKDIISLV